VKRRQFLRTLGLAGGTALVMPGLFTQAQTPPGPPKRFIMLTTGFGWTYDTWKLRVGGKSEDKSWQLDLTKLKEEEFSRAMAPLFPHRKRLLALDGLSLATAELDVDGDRHQKGWLNAWTGDFAYMGGSGFAARSASLDQLIARHIRRKDRLPSLELAIQTDARNVNHAGFNLQMPMERSPVKVWERLFGPSLAPDPLLKRQKSVLDFAHAEFKALAPKLAADDQKRLLQHYDLVSDLEKRITGMSQASCKGAPPKPDGLSGYDRTFDAFVDLVGMAFACDLTRVASISLGDLPTKDFGWDHVNDATHKGFAHEVFNSPTAYEAMTDYTKKHAQQLARLISKLESLKEADGSSVMDNTLIIWGSETADGWHGYLDYTPLIVGGSWHFKTGRYLYWPHETPISLLSARAASGYTQRCGKPHQHLLVSALQAMGIKNNKVGIGRIQNKKGEGVDCTGPLPDLT